MQVVSSMVHHHQPVVHVTRQMLPKEAPGWSEAGSRALRTALDELQVSVAVMASGILARTKRGQVLEAMVRHQGIVRTACMHIPTRDSLREAAEIITAAGNPNGRKLVYEAALRAVGEVRPDGAIVH